MQQGLQPQPHMAIRKDSLQTPAWRRLLHTQRMGVPLGVRARRALPREVAARGASAALPPIASVHHDGRTGEATSLYASPQAHPLRTWPTAWPAPRRDGEDALRRARNSQTGAAASAP